MPAFPDFDDDALAELTSAFQARSKAITYHAPRWNITREQLDDERERLNVDADGIHGDPRLSVWADRVIWFRLCRGRPKNGWDFMLSFHGNADNISATEIVKQFISSMASTGHLSIWQNVSPIVERPLTPNPRRRGRTTI